MSDRDLSGKSWDELLHTFGARPGEVMDCVNADVGPVRETRSSCSSRYGAVGPFSRLRTQVRFLKRSLPRFSNGPSARKVNGDVVWGLTR